MILTKLVNGGELMLSKFYLLEKKRQLEIINAGFEVFGRYEYAKASTEIIAKKAGVSKGLLFFYFKNKRDFFIFLFKYAEQILRFEIDNEPTAGSKVVYESEFNSKSCITDFFEVIEFVTERKYAVLERMPYIMTFMLMAMHSKDDIVRDVLSAQKKEEIPPLTDNIFQSVNYDKFRSDVEPSTILEMLGYLLDGYIQTKLNMNDPIVLDELMQKYKQWAELLKRAAYREDKLKGESI